MDDYSAFLSAILAAPDDDMPRLVFADWLEEHGEALRAEFIRVQIENHHRPSPMLTQRSEELLARHRERWNIPGISGVQTFRRGFVEGLRMAAGDFLANAERIERLAPVTELRLPIALDHLAALAAVPWLNRIEHLDLTGNVGLGSRLDDFFGLAALPRLQSLELRNCQLWPEHIASLARLAKRWPRLERLNLSGNPIGDEGAERIAESIAFSGLEALILRCDEQQFVDAVHAMGAASLARSATLSNLRTLDLHGHYVGDAGFVNIFTSETLRKLNSLNLSYNEIGMHDNDCFQSMFEDSNLPELRMLYLDGNRVDVNTMGHIALSWHRLARMERLSLRDCGFTGPRAFILNASAWRDHIDLGAIEGEAEV